MSMHGTIAQSYHALIDAGAFLRDKTSNEVAKLIFQLYLLQSDSAVRKKVDAAPPPHGSAVAAVADGVSIDSASHSR
jgi:hypothetical protein